MLSTFLYASDIAEVHVMWGYRSLTVPWRIEGVQFTVTPFHSQNRLFAMALWALPAGSDVPSF